MNKPMTVDPWVKKLGQEHLSTPERSQTLCGKPMLGNNYEKVIPVEERKPCEKCRSEMKKLGLLFK